MELVLLEAIKLYFQSNKKIYVSSDSLYYQLSLSKKEDLQKIVNFFSLSNTKNHPLIGLKLLSYQNWLMNLRNSKRYCNLIFPT